jgi:hypothetical protein
VQAPGPQRIKDLCQQWVDAATPVGGGLQIGSATETFRLLRNGIAFHALSLPELRSACIGLTTVLLRPGLSTVIDWDHMWLWSWCGEVMCGGRSTYFTNDERELKTLLSLCCRAALAGTYRPDQEGWKRQRDLSMSMEPNAREHVQHSQEALAYLAFPLLEGILKKECQSFVAFDGTVLQDFRSLRRKYTAARNDRCSSLRDLLWLLYREVATTELRDDLDEQRAHLAAFAAPDEDGFDVLYRWRNSSLHGAVSFPTVGGTVLNTALLVGLHALTSEYDTLRQSIVEHVQWETRTAALTSSYRSPWSYYPPYY